MLKITQAVSYINMAALKLNDIVIESRESDHFINATQLCKAGGKRFNNWYQLDTTKDLIEALERDLRDLNTGIPVFKNLVEIKKGRYNSGSWIHPDLAIQLAQWICPVFAIQVSRWVRELFIVGHVSLDSCKTDEELIKLQQKVHELEIENKEQEGRINRLHNIQIELLSFKKRVSKEETLYIVSTADYARQGIFKIGRTKTKMSFRSSSHNVTHIKGDRVKVLRKFKVNDSALVERNVHTKLSGLLLEGEREFFICPYDLLESVVELIVDNDDEENQQVTKIIDTVFKLKQHTFSSVEWTSGIPSDFFKEYVSIAEVGVELGKDKPKSVELDVSSWSEADRQEFVANCINEYVKQQNKVNEKCTLIWKTFQTVLVAGLGIPKSKFKALEWKCPVKEEVKKNDNLDIKWKSS